MFARPLLTTITLLLVLVGGVLLAQQIAQEKTGRIKGRVLAVPNVENLAKVRVHSIELFVRDSGRAF
jgi:hypothetical protein